MSPSRDRRGEFMAGLAGLVCLGSFGLFLPVSLYYGYSTAMFAASWLCLGVLGVWVLTWLQLHQQRLLEEERFELAELERDRRERLGGAKSVFDDTDLDQMESLAMGRRLRIVEKWFVPVLALLVAGFEAIIGLKLQSWGFAFDFVEARDVEVQNHLVLLACALGVAFAAFLLSRSALGLARIREFRLLRAAGNATFGMALGAFAVAVAVLISQGADWQIVERWTAHGIGVLMLLLSVELIVNFVLDFYRPRIPGVEQRAFYDSRLLGMFSEPGGLLKSLADAVDYQFGFKVSETWFYQLLGRWIVPLTLSLGVVLWGLTSIVVVPQGSEAVIERLRFGGQSQLYVAAPGMTLTAPWPVDRATLIETDRVRRLEIGYEQSSERARKRNPNDPELWTVKHREREYVLLVPDRQAAKDETLPINLMSVTIPIQWRVKPGQVLQYYRQAHDAEGIIEAIAYRELVRFAGQSDVLDLLSTGGAEAANKIRESLQHELDHAGLDGGDLGVEVVHMSLASVHPATDSADAYEEVVNAYQRKESTIYEARGRANELMVMAGGLRYTEVYDAVVAEDAAAERLRQARAAGGEGTAEQTALAEQTRVVESLLRTAAGGQAGTIVARAESLAFNKVQSATSDAEMFHAQLNAYEVSPEIFQLRQHLQAVEEGLRGLRKYVVALDDTSKLLIQMDLTPPQPVDLIKTTLGGIKEQQR